MIKRDTKAYTLGKTSPLAIALLLGLVAPNFSYAYENMAREVNVLNQNLISGNVIGSDGPIGGVTITVKENPSISSSTDSKGAFSIKAANGQTLVFSIVGYDKLEKVVSSSVMNVTLTESNEALEEVVVVGYGIQQKKESLTGAVQSVSGSKLRDVTTPSVENMLNGKAAGVYVSPGAGRPGSKGGVVIRGQASINGTTNPLWVIDGVIVGSNPGEINPDDIENLTVLKDAASTSIYGSQGANGVVVVTTKRPSARAMTLNFSTRMGFNSLNNGNLEVMNGAELYDYYASFANANEIKFSRWNTDLRDSNFDWWKLATKTGFVQNHNVSLQGGTEKLQSFMSLGYYDEVGAVKVTIMIVIISA